MISDKRKKELQRLATEYRGAIVKAFENNEFHRGPFNRFPDACCASASDLLGRYLKEHEIPTKVVSGSDKNTTHAWLVLDDEVLKKNLKEDERTADVESIQKMKSIIKIYGYDNGNKSGTVHPYHDFEFILRGCTIIDITGSQTQFRTDSEYFNYSIPVYVGKADDFHKLFDIMDINDFYVNDYLDDIYRTVQKYL